MRKITLLIILFVLPVFAYSQETISPGNAIDHIGERNSVCGEVVSTKYAEYSRGKPTFLNLDKPLS